MGEATSNDYGVKVIGGVKSVNTIMAMYWAVNLLRNL